MNAYMVLVGNLKERDDVEDLCVDYRVILMWILREISVNWIKVAVDGDSW